MTNQLTLRQQVDFDAMEGPELLHYCGDSGMKWADGSAFFVAEVGETNA